MDRIDVSNLTKQLEESRGFSDKYWVNNNGIKQLIKYNGPTFEDQDVMECLAADILNRLNINTVNVSLGYNQNAANNPYCCIVDNFLTSPADKSINLANSEWVKVSTTDEQKKISIYFYKLFAIFMQLPNINEQDLNSMKRDYVRMLFGDCIIDNEDRRLKNIEAIYNENDSSYRLAPSFDNGLAFNAFAIGDVEGYCHLGNELFAVDSLTKYIMTHFLDEVSDIIENLDNLINNDLETLICKYGDEISKEKLTFIYDYLTSINEKIKNFKKNKTK